MGKLGESDERVCVMHAFAMKRTREEEEGRGDDKRDPGGEAREKPLTNREKCVKMFPVMRTNGDETFRGGAQMRPLRDKGKRG